MSTHPVGVAPEPRVTCPPGAETETADPILDGVAGAEDEHRLVEIARPPLAQEIEAVAIGQAEVQHHRIVRRIGQGVTRLGATAGDPHCVGLFSQRALDEAADFALILDDQDLHGWAADINSGRCDRCNVCTWRASPTTSQSGRYSWPAIGRAREAELDDPTQ